MADEVSRTFVVHGEVDAVRQQWRDDPPKFLRDYQLTDESYETLVFQTDAMGIGMKILMWGFAKTVYSLACTFRAEDGNTRVTVLGQALEPVRDEFGEYVFEHAIG